MEHSKALVADTEGQIEGSRCTAVVSSTADEATEQAHRLYQGELLAPMVRASTTPLRVLALMYGANAVYTEELVDKAIIESKRVVNERLQCIDYIKDTSNMSHKSRKKLDNCPALLLRIHPSVERGKLICQVGSGEPELALRAALHVCQDVDAIDINMGCPKKFSVSGGMGSALLNDVERASKIVQTLSNHLRPRGISLSVKLRLLVDTQSTVDFVAAMINAGANAVAIHARRAGDESHKPADWDTLRQVVCQCVARFPHVPILVNGDFYTRDEFTQFQRDTGARGVLLARPALYNTSIFRKPPGDATASVISYGYESPLLLSKTAVIQEYMKLSVRYEYHYKNIKYCLCEMMNNRRAPSERAIHLSQSYPGGQTISKICSLQSVEEMCQLWGVNYNEALIQQRADEHVKTTLQAGEHKYRDSYFLINDKASDDEEGQSAKRARIAPEVALA